MWKSLGHPVVPNRLLDATIRHPASRFVLSRVAAVRGVAAQDGVDAKAKRYPPRGGKVVTACAAETWGYVHECLDDFLADIAVLASQRQVARGVHPTRWLARWRTQLSVQIARGLGRAILAAASAGERPCCISVG